MKKAYKKMTTSERYEMITTKITDIMKTGTNPWSKPWIAGSTSGADHNCIGHNEYHGINTMLTFATRMQHGYPTGQWLTYNQAKALGTQRLDRTKGKHVPIIYWKMLPIKEEGKPDKVIPMLFHFTVFNLAEIPEMTDKLAKSEQIKNTKPAAIPEGKRQEIIDNYLANNGPAYQNTAQDRAYYVPAHDSVHMPMFEQFPDSDQYFATAYHELGHSTGHKSRLDRPELMGMSDRHDYSREELVAELTSAYLCSHIGIENHMQNAAYLKNWASVLDEQTKWVVWAASRAEKSAKHILGIKETSND